jgi:hypothetical protein
MPRADHVKFDDEKDLDRFVRRVFDMKDEGLNGSFIANVLGVSRGTLGDRMRRWKKLRGVAQIS